MAELSEAQRDRLAQFATDQCVDMHCHCLPGLDDGPPTMADALQLCRAIVADGVTTVFATVHQLGAYGRSNDGRRIRAAVDRLQTEIDARDIPLRVIPGAEVRIDEQIPELLRTGEVLTLAGSHLLLELPDNDYVEAVGLIHTLNAMGVRTIIAHPERLGAVKSRPQLVWRWLDAGALLQVTAASLSGQFGARAEQLAWDLASSGLAALVAADAHGARHRVPRLSQAIELLSRRCGLAVARRLCVENPGRLARARVRSRPACISPHAARADVAAGDVCITGTRATGRRTADCMRGVS